MQLSVRQANVTPDPQAGDVRSILGAAWAVLERSRFRSLKVRQVLLASNCSASNFYRHFHSKSHLLLALLKDETERADRLLSRRIAAAGSAEAQLRAWLAFNISTIYRDDCAERARLFLDPGLLEELPGEVRLLHDVMGNRLVAVIERGISEGVFHSTDANADATMVQNLMRGLIDNGLVGQLDGDEAKTLRTTYEFVRRALRAAPSG